MVLVPLASGDKCGFGTKWSWYLLLVNGTKWSLYLWLAKMSVRMERSGLGTFGLRR